MHPNDPIKVKTVEDKIATLEISRQAGGCQSCRQITYQVPRSRSLLLEASYFQFKSTSLKMQNNSVFNLRTPMVQSFPGICGCLGGAGSVEQSRTSRQVAGKGSFIIHDGEDVVFFTGIAALNTQMVDPPR